MSNEYITLDSANLPDTTTPPPPPPVIVKQQPTERYVVPPQIEILDYEQQLSQLDDDCLTRILTFLLPEEVLSMQQTCRRFYAVGCDDMIWGLLYRAKVFTFPVYFGARFFDSIEEFWEQIQDFLQKLKKPQRQGRELDLRICYLSHKRVELKRKKQQHQRVDIFLRNMGHWNYVDAKIPPAPQSFLEQIRSRRFR
jgi:hypothetical protein